MLPLIKVSSSGLSQKQQNLASEALLLPLTKVSFIGSQAEAANMVTWHGLVALVAEIVCVLCKCHIKGPAGAGIIYLPNKRSLCYI